jgi:putative redox protein
VRDGKVATHAGTKLQQDVTLGPHALSADEPVDAGGGDAAPAPHDFLLAALGSCTSMTVKLYADRKGWPLERVEVALEQGREEGVHQMRRVITLHGPLSDEQRARLLEIAEKCPVHKTLTGEIRITSRLG